MDAISTAELLEIAMLLRDDLEDQFQFWLSITFAVIVASFIAGDRLRYSWRTIVGALYLLATVLFAVRLSESAQNLMLYLTPALERGAEWSNSGDVVFLLRAAVMLVGTCATIWFLYAGRKESGGDA